MAIPIRLLFIGELDIHQRDLLPFLNQNGYDVTVLNTAHWERPTGIKGTKIPLINLYDHSKLPRLFDAKPSGWYGKASYYRALGQATSVSVTVKEIIKQKHIDVIYGSWGYQSLPELDAIRKLKTPIAYEFLTYPVSWTQHMEKLNNLFNKRIIECLSGRIISTPQMLKYFNEKFSLKNGKNLVFVESYSKRCFYKKRLPLLSETDGQPHVVFLGSDVWDILPQIQEMVKRRIHVHTGEDKNLEPALKTLRQTGFYHSFAKFGYDELYDGTLATFLTQFEACWVTYNFGRMSSLIRFHNSIPNRFSFALTAGIPIVMPKGFLLGCEEILNNYKMGYVYSDYNDLNAFLANKRLIAEYAKNALENCEAFTLERNFPRLNQLLSQL